MKYSYLLIILIGLSSCKDKLDSCFKPSGDLTKRNIDVGTFRDITIYDNLNIIFIYDSLQNVKIEAGQNLIKNIKIEQTGLSLKISNKNTCNWLRSYNVPINVYISSPTTCIIFKYSSGQITSSNTLRWDEMVIHQYSPGDIRLNLDVNQVDVDLNGLGAVELTGKSKQVKAHLYNLSSTAYGILDSRNLITGQFDLVSDTQADCFVYSSGILNASIKNIGNVHYFGNPSQKNFQDTGDGEFINVE